VDVVTLLRCAAASKPLRRDILDPDFLRLRRDRRRRAAAANGGFDNFDPDLFLSFSYWFRGVTTRELTTHVVETATPPWPRFSIHPSTSRASWRRSSPWPRATASSPCAIPLAATGMAPCCASATP